jgi:hypothetical protein
MRRIRQILQLHFGAQASARAIARELGVARSTVQGYLARASSAELGWPLPGDLTDPMLEERLFPPAILKLGVRRYVEPDCGVGRRATKEPFGLAALDAGQHTGINRRGTESNADPPHRAAHGVE